MPPRSKTIQLSDDQTVLESQAKIQQLLTEAYAKLDEAKRLADASGEGFTFLNSYYTPAVTRTITSGGEWDFETDDWNGSSC